MDQPECITAFLAEMKIKNSLKEKNEWKVKKKVMQEKLKTLGDYKSDLQKEINHIVRLIDFGQPCICTGSYNGKMNAGHYYSVGSNDTIRFNFLNIHLQSEHSNTYLSGDTLNYQEGIKKTYGLEYFEEMHALKSTPLIKLSKSEIEEKIVIARNISKALIKINEVYSVENRIILRKKYNKQIGIYD